MNAIGATLESESTEETLEVRVRSYKHPMLVRRLVKELNIETWDAEEIFEDTKEFLCQCSQSKTPLTPTERVDKGWHAFILFTRDYEKFCKEFFGHFIHHTPLEEEGGGPCKHNYCKGCTHGNCE